MGNNRFNLVPKINLPRSKFDLSYEHKTTFNAGKLVPVCVQEVLPGDSFEVNQTNLIRLASSLVTPLMDTLELKFEWFFVPNRLVWDNWERMNGQQDNPGDSTDFLVPSVSISASTPKYWSKNTILEYMGVPPFCNVDYINILPLRAYAKIYDDWYRDENLCKSFRQHIEESGPGTIEWINAVDQIYGKGDCSYSSTTDNVFDTEMTSIYEKMFGLATRAKKKDLFTSSLPFPQKGPGVSIPLGTTAPVSFNLDGFVGNANIPVYYKSGESGTSGIEKDSLFASGQVTGNQQITAVADLSEATAATINSLRQAFQLQKYYEQLARGGSRYTEIIRSFFGVTSPDARLQRSEYLGGFVTPINFQSVAQTSATSSVSPQGHLTSFGIGVNQNHGFQRSFTEHGYIICMASVVSTPSYSQGLPRFLSRRGKLDFYLPTFAHLGEQAILNKEIYARDREHGDEVFGYQERFVEYRFNQNMLSAQMAVDNPIALNSWTLSQKFDSLPALNNAFIEETPPIDRVVAVGSGTGAHQFILDVFFKINAVRVMPVYGVPGLVDHF